MKNLKKHQNILTQLTVQCQKQPFYFLSQLFSCLTRTGARADVYRQSQTGLVVPGRNIALLYRLALSGLVAPHGYCLTLRRLMSYIYIYIYIYGAPILDVSRSHTTTQHSR